MDSELKQNSPSAHSDDFDRLAASTRKKTLEPLSDGIKADERSDEYIANQDILNGPIANISIDSEQTVAEDNQTAALISKEHHHTAGFVIGGIIALLLAGAFVFVFFME